MNIQGINSIEQKRVYPHERFSANRPESPDTQRQRRSSCQHKQVPVFGGLLWICPLRYQLAQQLFKASFAFLIIYYLSKIAKR